MLSKDQFGLSTPQKSMNEEHESDKGESNIKSCISRGNINIYKY